MQKSPTPNPCPTDPDEQVDFLIAHWEEHGNLDGIILPEGSNPLELSLRMVVRRIMAQPGGMQLCDTTLGLPVGKQRPTDWNAILDRYPPDTLMRALVEHGTPGAISLDMCPEGTLITSARNIRERIAAGLKPISLQRHGRSKGKT